MSCQKRISRYLKKNLQAQLKELASYCYKTDFAVSRFEVVETFDFAGFFRHVKKQADLTFSEHYRRSASPVDNIFSIITSHKYADRSNYSRVEFAELSELIRQKISRAVAKKSRIGLVLPGFTIKCFNVLRVESRRSPDLAELASLLRLWEICYQIGKVYPPGAEFVVLTDGLAYARMFGEDPYFAICHRQTLASWLNLLQLESTIKIVDLTTLLPTNFTRASAKVARHLAKEWRQTNDLTPLAEFVTNTKGLVNYEVEIMRDMQLFYKFQEAHGDKELTHANIESQIITKAVQTTFQYETFLRTLSELDVIGKKYPAHLLCTGRPKPGQLGINFIHEKSNNFPWNGVGVISKSGHVNVHPESVVKYSPDYTPVYIKGDHAAFYYREN